MGTVISGLIKHYFKQGRNHKHLTYFKYWLQRKTYKCAFIHHSFAASPRSFLWLWYCWFSAALSFWAKQALLQYRQFLISCSLKWKRYLGFCKVNLVPSLNLYNFPQLLVNISTKFCRNIYQISPIYFVSLGITTLYSHIYS